MNSRGLIFFLTGIMVTAIVLGGIFFKDRLLPGKENNLGKKKVLLQQTNSPREQKSPIEKTSLDGNTWKVFEENQLFPYTSRLYPDWKKKHITSNTVMTEIKNGKHKGKKRREIDFFFPNRKITYEVTLDPERPGMPLPKKGWGDG